MPKPLSKSELRRRVFVRAGGCCEYCWSQARYSTHSYAVEHIIPKHRRGKTVLENLALSCCFCNTYKGPNLSGLDPQTGALTRLFHPRQDHWPEHFRWNGPLLVGLTAVWRTTIAVLRMNRDDAVAVRLALLEEESP